MIDPQNISCCLLTKDPVYPWEIQQSLRHIPFGETLIRTHSDSPHRKHELFEKAKHEYLYYQDDDCIAPAGDLIQAAEPEMLTCAMKTGHLEAYKNSPCALIGWGGIFPKEFLNVLDLYRAIYGEDNVYRRETERILTHLVGVEKQKRLDLPITDLPSAWAADRLWRQPHHNDYRFEAERRCNEIIQRRQEFMRLMGAATAGVTA